MHSLTINWAVAAYILLSILPQHDMAAQTFTPPAGKTPVVVAVVDTVNEKDAEVVIVRRANQLPHDVILMSAHRVQADLLAEAIWTLETARSTDGIVPTKDTTYRIANRLGSKDRKELKEYAKSWVKLLKDDSPRRPVEGYGELRYITVYLPDKKKNVIVRPPKPD